MADDRRDTLLNPHLEVQPHYATAEDPETTQLRNVFLGAGLSREQADANLEQIWVTANRARRNLWDQQAQRLREEEEEAENTRRAEEEETEEEMRRNTEGAARREGTSADPEDEEEDNSRMPSIMVKTNIREGSFIPSSIPLRASRYANQQMREAKYVRLWYWTMEGMTDARTKSDPVFNDELDTIVIRSSRNGKVGLRNKLDSERESQHAVPDTELTWVQILEAVRHYIRAMHTCGWKTDIAQMFSEFYDALADLHAEYVPYQQEAVIQYQDIARKNFYEELRDKRDVSDLRKINHTLLDTLMARIAKGPQS